MALEVDFPLISTQRPKGKDRGGFGCNQHLKFVGHSKSADRLRYGDVEHCFDQGGKAFKTAKTTVSSK